MPDLIVASNADALADRAARAFLRASRTAIQLRGRFCVALSGGSTPQRMYARLSQLAFAGQVDWTRVFLFWGDERCVPPDHADSNYGAARQTLLVDAPIPDANIFRIRGELPVDQAARLYDAELRAFFVGENVPHLDLVLLGLGEDGHTASLFPESPALLETQPWASAVAHTDGLPPKVARVTLTLPVLNAAREIFFLVSGDKKAAILAKVLNTPASLEEIYPAQLVRPVSGRVAWLVDREALSIWSERHPHSAAGGSHSGASI